MAAHKLFHAIVIAGASLTGGCHDAEPRAATPVEPGPSEGESTSEPVLASESESEPQSEPQSESEPESEPQSESPPEAASAMASAERSAMRSPSTMSDPDDPDDGMLLIL